MKIVNLTIGVLVTCGLVTASTTIAGCGPAGARSGNCLAGCETDRTACETCCNMTPDFMRPDCLDRNFYEFVFTEVLPFLVTRGR